MRLFLSALTLLLFSFNSDAYFLSYFEVKLNNVDIYHSTNNPDLLVVNLEADSLKETDLVEIRYTEWGATTKNDYELHIKVENTTVDLTFINDEPVFFLNMGWFTQFKNKKTSLYLYQTKYTGSTKKDLVHKIVDILIS